MQNASHKITNQRLDAVHKHIRETITRTKSTEKQKKEGLKERGEKRKQKRETKIKEKKSFSTSRSQETTKNKMT